PSRIRGREIKHTYLSEIVFFPKISLIEYNQKSIMGRFISVDPIKAGNNWYSYCADNPVRYIDPLGLDVMAPGRDLGSDHYWYDTVEVTETDNTTTVIVTTPSGSTTATTTTYNNNAEPIARNSYNYNNAWKNLSGMSMNPTGSGLVGPIGNIVSQNLDKPKDMTISLSGTIISVTGEITFDCNTFQFGWDCSGSPNTLFGASFNTYVYDPGTVSWYEVGGGFEHTGIGGTFDKNFRPNGVATHIGLTIPMIPAPVYGTVTLTGPAK
ncbi:MAG TPA: RHS repeat-associated core domain-containing protein, partial [Bacillota bacterium]|nr:RHS repeat-associated core domain-containing protein [Bacillota bacterium]